MQLASNLDLAAAKPLWTELVATRAQPIEIDASNVERLGGLCLQVLLAALMSGEELMVAEACA